MSASVSKLPKKPGERLAKPPKHLQKATKEWWFHVVQSYELEERHILILTLACQALDRGEQARKLLLEYGLTYTDQFGQPRPRPEVIIEKDSRIAFAPLVRELGLSEDDPDRVRPPRLRYGGR